jgi:lysozyme
MTDRQRLIEQLVLHEGLRTHPYVDTVGKVTIGVGRNLTDKGISSREVFDLLDHDVDECVTDLAANFPWFIHLDAVRQRVIIDLRFNLGPTRFRQFVRTLRSVGAGDYDLAASQMLESLWAAQVKARAIRLSRMMATGDDYTEIHA